MSRAKNLVTQRVLESLTPLSGLTGQGLRELAGRTMVEAHPAGRNLFVQGTTDRWTYYLLDGEVELFSNGDLVETVIGSSAAAKMPLVHGQPRRVTARTKTGVRIIRIDNDLLAVLLGRGLPSAYELVEFQADDARVENRLFNRIYHEFMADQLVLPSMPDIAIRVRQAVQDTRNDISVVAKIVQVDPALTARLIQVANSPLHRGQTHIDNCRAAITRLGLTVTRNLVVSFTLHSIFRTRAAVLRKRMSELWRHSSRVAALSYVLASKTPGFDPDRALLAGLVHDIGELPILNHLEAYPDLLSDPTHLDKTVATLRGQIGAMVLRKWKFSSDLVVIALESEDWYRDPNTRPDYCDIVLVAQLHSFVGTSLTDACPPLDEVPAFAKLARGRLDPKLSLAVLDEAREDIVGVLQLLHG